MAGWRGGKSEGDCRHGKGDIISCEEFSRPIKLPTVSLAGSLLTRVAGWPNLEKAIAVQIESTAA
jgi:hypothetical protein